MHSDQGFQGMADPRNAGATWVQGGRNGQPNKKAERVRNTVQAVFELRN